MHSPLKAVLIAILISLIAVLLHLGLHTLLPSAHGWQYGQLFVVFFCAVLGGIYLYNLLTLSAVVQAKVAGLTAHPQPPSSASERPMQAAVATGGTGPSQPAGTPDTGIAPDADHTGRADEHASGAGNDAQPALQAHSEGREEEGREEGVVKWFDQFKNYGFIVRPSGADLFVHYSEIRAPDSMNPDPDCLYEGQRVSYRVVHLPRGMQAQDVVVDTRDTQ